MASIRIPTNFLKGKCPNACLRRLDFMQTSPPIAAFRDHFAAIVDNVLTPDECRLLLRLAEESAAQTTKESATATWDRAMVNVGSGQPTMAVDTRNCGRILWDTPEVADRLLHRLGPFLQNSGIESIYNQPLVTGRGPVKRGDSFRLSRLNERMRFLRYQGGEYFRPHSDGNYVTEDGSKMSLFTVHLYLNGTGTQDVEELERRIRRLERTTGLLEEDGGEVDIHCLAAASSENSNDGMAGQHAADNVSQELLGGATSFTDGHHSEDAVRVFPRAGSVLIFQQRNLVHSGDDVFSGVKYTVRTDVMYKREGPPS